MDYHSKLLVNLKSNVSASVSEISDVIIGWKNTFSFYWYHQYINDDQKKLDFVFNLLFELTEYPDSNVTIASFNAIGALLVALSPFRSRELILSFKNKLSSLEVSPNTSCAVIATFVFLSHYVSDTSISSFVDSTPIFPHFGADLRMFIHHIPNLIEQMDRLNMEFHQALLRSLISSFGRNPVSSFIESIMLLIKRFPNKLLSDLMEFIESNKLEDTLLSVGGPILNDCTFSELLSIQQKYAFLNTLKRKLFIPKTEQKDSENENEAETTFSFNESDYNLQTEITATELEQAVSIICGLKKQSDEELNKFANQISNSIWNRRNELKSVFQRILFPLANNIDELRPTKDDSSNEMSRKIMALGYLENANDDEILTICEPFIESRDECFISVLTFLSKSMKEKSHKLFEKLFEKDDYSWVQRIAILNLIDSMDQFKMEAYISNYNQKCIDFLIKCALSLQTELSSQSRIVIGRFVSLNNVELFRDSILKCDFFNFQITKNILMLLNVIVNSISPSPFHCFIGIVLELFDFTLSDIINVDSDDSSFEGINIYPSFVSDCFEFLSHYPGQFPYRRSIERICICKMQEVYYSFSQEKLFFQSMLDNSAQNSASISEASLNPSQTATAIHSNRKKTQAASQMTKMLKNNVRPILSTITTDVVADASLVRYEFLNPLKHCLQYLVSNQLQSAAYRPVFLKLLPIFPIEILPHFYEHSSIISNCQESRRKSLLSPDEIEVIKPKILRIFSSNRDQTVISRCCEFFYQSNIISQPILIKVKQIFENTQIKSSSSAFEFFKIIYSVEPETAMNYLKRLLNVAEQEKPDEKISIPDLTKNELALLSSNIPSVYKILSEMDNFSFLQFKTNRFSAKSWFENNDYTTWPLIDSDLNEEIVKMFDKSYSVRVKDCDLIDNQHWTFLMKNKTMFFRDTIRSYLDSHKYLLKSICIFKIDGEEEKNHFEFNEKIKKDINDSLDKFAKVLPTTALLLKKGKFIKSEILIKNFLKFSKMCIDEDLLDKMRAEFPDLNNNFNDYLSRIANKQKKNSQIKQSIERIVISKHDEINEEKKEDVNNELIVEKLEEQIQLKQDENQINLENHNEENQEQNEDKIIKTDETQKIADEQNQEKHDENQIKLNESVEDNQPKPEGRQENLTKTDEQNESNQIKSEERHEEQKEDSQTKSEDQHEEQKVENQLNQEEQHEKQKESDQIKSEEQHEEQKIENQPKSEEQHEEQKIENQPKSEEQHEEQKEGNQVKPEEQHEEQKEDNQIKPEEQHEEQKVENQLNQEEQHEDQKEDNQTKPEEQHEEQKEDNKTKSEEQHEEQKVENQLNQEEQHEEQKVENQLNQEEQHEDQKVENQPKPEEHQVDNQTKPEEENKTQSEEKRVETQVLNPTEQPENHNSTEIKQASPSPSPITNSIPEFDPNFAMKSKFLKNLCIHPPKSTIAITMYRMHLINRINEIRSPKQFFYFIRFLRINIVIPKNSREALAIRKNTVENYKPIINKFIELASGGTRLDSSDSDFDFYQEEKDLSFVLLEFMKLTTKLFSIHDLHKIIKRVSVSGKTDSIELLLVSNLVIHSSKFRNMVNNVFSLSNGLLSNYSIHQLKSSLLPRTPSLLSFIITTIKMLPDEESSMFFMRHYKTLIEDDIVSDFAIDYLSFYLSQQNQGSKNYDEYFDIEIITQMALQLFDTRRSVFKKAGEKGLFQILFSLMKGQFKNNLLQFQPLIEKLSVCGYSLPFVIDIVMNYFSTVAFNIYQIPITPSHFKILEQQELKEKQQQKKGKQKQSLSEEQKRQNMFNFQKDFGIKEIRIVQSIFQVCPSILNAMKLGKTLILASTFFDSLALIFGKLAPFEDCAFLGIFCIASLFYYEFINDVDKKKKFVDLVKSFEKQSSTFKSRSKALELIIEKNETNEFKLNFEIAFAVACLETNDNDKIEEVINLFKE